MPYLCWFSAFLLTLNVFYRTNIPYFIHQLPYSRVFSLFSSFLDYKECCNTCCDFIFSWGYPPQESWAHTGGRSISIEGFMAEPRGVYEFGTVLSCYFLDSDCVDLGPESRVWDPHFCLFSHSVPWAETRFLLRVSGLEGGDFQSLLHECASLPSSLCYDQRPDPRKYIWPKCAVELLRRKLFDQLNV